MSSNIRVFCPDIAEELIFKSFVFPGGEVGVKFDGEYPRPRTNRHNIDILLRAREAKDLIELAMVKDAIERKYNPLSIDLILPYIPYARQDRVCDAGEAFSLKVFANYINFLGFRTVTVLDPHSDVAPALINNVRVVTQDKLIYECGNLHSLLTRKTMVLVSPDAGANKKTAKVAALFKHSHYIRCDKLRDLSTGKIIETKVYAEREDLHGKDFLIVDDICDGGATFIELAKVLKAGGANTVGLYVTHGIFSRGVEHLFNNGIDKIWTTDSFIPNAKEMEDKHPNLRISTLSRFV